MSSGASALEASEVNNYRKLPGQPLQEVEIDEDVVIESSWGHIIDESVISFGNE